jgi:hypothetical protein
MKCNIVSPISCTYQDDWTALVICMRWRNWRSVAHIFPWESKQSLHKKFPAFYGNKMFTGARHKSADTARWIQATCCDCFFHILSVFLVFWRKFHMYFSSVACVLHALLISYWILSPLYLIDSTQCGASCCLIYLRFVTVCNIPLSRFSSDTPSLCACLLGWDSKYVNIAKMKPNMTFFCHISSVFNGCTVVMRSLASLLTKQH